MTDYRNLPLPLANNGLDVSQPPDKVTGGKYTRLLNVKNSTSESVLATRDGTNLAYTLGGSGTIHTIRRTDDVGLLFGKGTSIFRNTMQVTLPAPISGNPLTVARHHSAQTGRVFAYIGDSSAMTKISTGGVAYKWGIESPQAVVAAVASGVGNLTGNYDWRYTFFSSISGAESNPGPVANSLTLADQQATLTNLAASTDPQVDQKNIFRRGGALTDWYLVDTISNSTDTYIDNFSDADISTSDLLSMDNDVPFTTVGPAGNTLFGTPLKYVWGPFIGRYILACGDPNRPGYVYWTNADQSDSASVDNSLEVTNAGEPLLGGFIFDENPYVWTRDNLYTLDYGGPNAIPTFLPRQVSIGMGLVAPYGYCVGSVAVFFVSKDGIYATDCHSNLQSITNGAIRPIFLGNPAGDLLAIDFSQQDSIRLAYAPQEVHFFYKDTQGNYVHLVYDLPFQRWRRISQTNRTDNLAYGDENQQSYSLISAATDGNIYNSVIGGTTDNGATIHCQARTASLDMEIPLTDKRFGVLLLDADLQGNFLTVTPYINGETSSLPATVVTGTGRQNYSVSLLDTYARNIGFDLQWDNQATLFQLLVLFREDEEGITHWEQPDTSHGVPFGWIHVRDVYFCLRSAADVTFTHTIDGRAYTYTFPSTAGERRRIHQYLAPVRGKVYKYALDSAQPFRLYGEDTQLFLKPWNSAISYQPVTPFGPIGMAKFLRKEAGT
jgi:hypothetical protein